MGFVVPRYKHSAVDRNRLKRRLREVVRCEWLAGLPLVDVVVRALPGAYDRDFAALRDEMGRLRDKLQLAFRARP